MAKGVSKELEREVRRVLETSILREPGTRDFFNSETPQITVAAVRYLGDIGALSIKENPGGRVAVYSVTANGRAYYERLQAPRWHWFKRNLTTIIAVAALLVSIAAILVSAFD